MLKLFFRVVRPDRSSFYLRHCKNYFLLLLLTDFIMSFEDVELRL